jgi:uncharacterized protein affecting Mg2+/Co2+ transport
MYASGARLQSSLGVMKGSFQMKISATEEHESENFDATIAPVTLLVATKEKKADKKTKTV